jgi:phenylpropionate dioxygenase-like ring-hydroxylating dioxygenase large terminal subunit
VREWQGLVLAWHHPAGQPPGWEPDLPEMDPERWHRHAQRVWEVRTHVQEIGENGLDTAHVSAVHGVTLDEVPSVEMEDLRTEGPRMELSTRAVGSLTGTIRRVLWGLGLSMNEFVGPVATRVFITRTPLDDERVEMRMLFFVQRLPDAEATHKLGEIFTNRVATEVEQDIPIWEHKRYLERPVLCEGDGPIGAWRRWAAQFYPTAG